MKEPRGRVRFLDDDERQRLLASCKESKCPCLYTVVTLAISIGARYNEIMCLRSESNILDVNLMDESNWRVQNEDVKNGFSSDC